MTYREATPRDCLLLAEMNHRLIRDEGHRNPMTVPELAGRMRGWLADGAYRAILFEEDAGPVAYALFRTEPDAGIYLRQFFVSPAHRRRQVGTRAIDLLFRELFPAGARVTVEVLAQNGPALGFWTAAGFQRYSVSLERFNAAGNPPSVSPDADAVTQDDHHPLGLAKEAVRLVPYHPRWPGLFEQEATRLRSALGAAVGNIEHVGSTAIPGMSAKPIIDLVATVGNLASAHDLVPALERLGYEPRPDNPIEGRLFFVLGPRERRTHHLSLTEPGSVFWRAHLAFRDRLRTDPVAAAGYTVLKRRLAAGFARDRAAYTAAKRDFIESVLRDGASSPAADAGAGLVRVRRASAEDAPALEVLYRELVADPHIRVLPEQLAALAAAPGSLLLVVVAEGSVCGTALLTLCPDAMYRAQPFGVVENVVVAPAWRGRGLGRLLLDHVEQLALAHHCTKLMLLSGATRHEAHAFFRRCGFVGDTKQAFVKYRRHFAPPDSASP